MAEDTPEERQDQPADEAQSETPAETPPAEATPAEETTPAPEAPAEEPQAETAPAGAGEQDAAAAPEPSSPEQTAAGSPAAPEGESEAAAPEAPADEPAPVAASEGDDVAVETEEPEEEPDAPRVKPAIPGADLEVDIVLEGGDPLSRAAEEVDPYAVEDDEEAPPPAEEESEDTLPQPITSAAIDLAAGARYQATGKRKTAIARVILRPGDGTYTINGRPLERHFPRSTLQRNIRQPLEAVGYEARMDVIARMDGGGISAQAGALRHGISRALLEADPNLRGELKRRGFLTRDSRAKERKKAGLKKARKRPQFSKR